MLTDTLVSTETKSQISSLIEELQVEFHPISPDGHSLLMGLWAEALHHQEDLRLNRHQKSDFDGRQRLQG